jgi:hypothetical protein
MKQLIVKALKWCLSKFDDNKEQRAIEAAWPLPTFSEDFEPRPKAKKVIVPKATAKKVVAKKPVAKKTIKKAK